MGRTYKIILWAAGILGFVCVGIFCYYIYQYSTFTGVQEAVKSQLSSNVGDFISGTIGTILAFISTLFLFVTFRVQQVQFEKISQMPIVKDLKEHSLISCPCSIK